MLAMPDIKHIKNLRNEKSFSINAITKRTGISWITAKKYADQDHLPSEATPRKRGMMYDEKWGEIVSDWLFEDRALQKKLRRNNKGIYLDLKKEGFPGSYRTVCHFIADWKDTHGLESENGGKAFERLNHPPADAQVDFGLTEAVQDGKFKDIHCLIMSLPYSNGGYAVPLPSENQECFLEGLKTLFEQLGAVPRKIRIDNLAAAVVKARGTHGETVFTESFEHFALHYGFEPEACNARRGNEKGHVENKVGYIRYNFFTPSPTIRDLKHLREMLWDKTKKDQERCHYKKEQPIADLLAEERKYCLALPEEPYPVFKQTTAKANKYGEITLDNELIHVPNTHHHSYIHLITYWDRFTVLSPHGEVLGEGYRPYMNHKREIPWQPILKNWYQKPRSIPYSRYFNYLPGRIASYLSIESKEWRKERVKSILAFLSTHTMEEINEMFYELIPHDNAEETSGPHHPYDVNWDKYDSLQPGHVASTEEDQHE
ncbi:IS21 family transposase [Salibacterium lacus]|uniref:IS21 family transposase n=1 Tax=Salibacterium lacus TaxID=1898109 RepID=A0ABW5T423_9BACI